MKLVAGLGNIDDYLVYADAGADEVFIGYVPSYWMEEYGIEMPLNRREVLYYNVQIGSESELEILHEMVEERGVPVSIVLNALTFRKEQYQLIGRMMTECINLGFCSFIIADPALLLFISQQKWAGKVSITLSGEVGEMNEEFMRILSVTNLKRLIFHRKLTTEGIRQCINACKKSGKNHMEFEAFFLNEKCHFHGAFCNSMHCDEFVHICQVPYKLGPIVQPGELRDVFGKIQDMNMVGVTGCGLCALWKLREAGVTHLKLVGRGNYSEYMVRDIKAARMALKLLDSSTSEEYYIEHMKQCLFQEGCSKNCYYIERISDRDG